MRPLVLEFRAFGPYPETQRLDFAALPEGTLFLVHGPTGAGKTTILDAMCFALYGASSGEEREGRDMRCQVAAPETLTEVVFDFSIGRDRYRARRVPDQSRPKQRGEGLTEQKKEATLWPLDDEGQTGKPLAHGWSKVTKRLEELIGLDGAQFRQVVLLPQGQFRRLLTAGSNERETILERLFDTRRFRRLEEALKRRVAEMTKASELLVAQELTVAAQAAGLLGCEGEEPRAPGRERLDQAMAALAAEIELASKARAGAAEAAAASGRALHAGEADQEKLNALVRARERRELIDAELALVEAKRVELEAAERAQRVQPAIERRRRAGLGRDAAARDREAAERALALASAALQESAQLLAVEREPDAEAAREDAVRRVNTLQGLREAVRELSGARRLADDAEAAAGRAEAARTLAVEAVTETERRLKSIEEERASAAAEADGRAELVADQERARRAEADAQQHAALRRKASETERLAEAARANREKVERRFESVARELDELAGAFEAGQAARLAASLREGEACPVCGSVEHPRPARAEKDLPTPEGLEAAEASLEAARVARDQARDAAARAEEVAGAAAEAVRQHAERTSARDDDDLAKLAEATRDLTRRLEAAEGARARAQAAAASATALSAELDRARATLQSARDAAESARSTAAERKGERDARLASVPEELRPPGALEEALALAEAEVAEGKRRLETAAAAHALAAERKAASDSTLAAAGSALAAAAAEVEAAQGAVDVALAEAGFAELGDCERASRDGERRSALARELADHDRERLKAIAEVERCEAAGQGLSPPDLTALRSSHAEAETRRNEAQEAQARLDERRRGAQLALEQLRALGAERLAVEERYGVLGRVAALATGNNDLNLSLHRFVLGALLDQVLAVASVRLARMSRGRYHLRRVGGLRDGRRAAGLDLEVDDTYTGHARPVSTLSGGESFLAALALALSLAQVVQEHAGGVRLDALFIDEGFGSLDLEALDLAITTLETLGAEGGRLVGVISHVTELAQRIPTRLEVTADPRGSRARLIAP